MEDRELKHLSRSELLDIIYTLRKNQDTLERMNADLKAQLEDRRIDIENSGSIAEASLAVTKIFDEAQKAADIYLSEIRRRAEELGSDDADAVDVSEPCGGGGIKCLSPRFPEIRRSLQVSQPRQQTQAFPQMSPPSSRSMLSASA